MNLTESRVFFISREMLKDVNGQEMNASSVMTNMTMITGKNQVKQTLFR